ncbi:MAG: hypothetical protein NTU98_03515 [Bacteroidetes bacterium]|nr:hypothetical protein [Bacteroidota bacterium]
MKKSNILITCASGLALCWILLIGWFAATAINNYRQGKDPVFARSHSQYMESKKKTFPVPVKELIISGAGDEILTIVSGKEFSVLAHPRVWDCIYTDLKNGKGMIRFKRQSDYNDPITIRLPEIPSVSIDHVKSVSVELFTGHAPRLKCTRVGYFDVMNCKLRMLNIDFPGKNDQQEILIAECNQIDTLVASVRGFGNLRLEMTGKYKNQLSLSESIKLEAKSEILKKLALK